MLGTRELRMTGGQASEVRPSGATTSPGTTMIPRLRSLALRGLARMYRPDERLFAYRLRRTARGIVSEGLSRRYTAIALIGLAEEGEAAASPLLAGHGLHDVCGRLVGDVVRLENLGDVALTVWAARAVGYPDWEPAWERLVALRPMERPCSTVELAWTLAALCAAQEPVVAELRERLADRLVSSSDARSGMFPHLVGGNGGGLRAHVSCFADLVYPIHALAHYVRLSGDPGALAAARRCAQQICRLQGSAGQWWWHYDRRTGDVVERYPVYAVHQDAMAPMALFALEEAAGGDFTGEIERGFAWLAHAPELDGRTLVDEDADLVWRKVARREPGKLARYVQAVASRVHPALRAPGLDVVFPIGVVDYEDRPYHLGWLLYAWRPARLVRWSREAGTR